MLCERENIACHPQRDTALAEAADDRQYTVSIASDDQSAVAGRIFQTLEVSHVANRR